MGQEAKTQDRSIRGIGEAKIREFYRKMLGAKIEVTPERGGYHVVLPDAGFTLSEEELHSLYYQLTLNTDDEHGGTIRIQGRSVTLTGKEVCDLRKKITEAQETKAREEMPGLEKPDVRWKDDPEDEEEMEL